MGKVSKKHFPYAQHLTNSPVKQHKALVHDWCIKLSAMV